MMGGVAARKYIEGGRQSKTNGYTGQRGGLQDLTFSYRFERLNWCVFALLCLDGALHPL